MALIARDEVKLTLPGESGGPTRIIAAQTLDGTGDATRGLTGAHFTGNVQYSERAGALDRQARSAVLDVALAPGFGAIEEATFTKGARFADGTMFATAASAKYALKRGALELTGSEPASPTPHVVNDQITVDEVLAAKPAGIVLSPGPCTPNEAGICMDLIRAAAKAQVPLFGVCLGHQAIGQVFGGKVVRAPVPMHGKLSGVVHKGQSVFEDVPSPFQATRYHSLIVDRAGFPAELEVTAETGDIIMGLRHRTLPIHGVQFHPESIASEHGHKILENFLKIAGDHPDQQARRKAA